MPEPREHIRERRRALVLSQEKPKLIKLTICVNRRPGMSHREFDNYWREQHAPLLQSVTEFSRHVRRYVQCHRVDVEATFAGGSEWDGIVELYFDSAEAMEVAFAEPKYAEVIRTDEMKFVDLETARIFVGEELQVI